MDELHDQAASHCKVEMTVADWRAKMMECLKDNFSFYLRQRYESYQKAGVPEKIYHELDMVVFHAAMKHHVPKDENAPAD